MILAHMILNSAIIVGTALAVADPSHAKVRTEMLVTTDWLAQHLKDPNVVVLCIAGGGDFYSEGHIPGARLIKTADITIKRGDIPNELPPVEQLAKVFAAAGVTPKARIVLYGDDYNLLAARAYFTLDYLGLAAHASLLDGGISKWKNELRPLSKDVRPPANGKLEPHVNAKVLVETPEMQKLAQNHNSTTSQSLAIVDARPPAEYQGERHSADVHKLGHIPGASSLYWQELLVSREDPVLLPPDQLREKFAQAQVTTQTTSVITYCRTGMQSSFDYFVAKYLGYDARMYDASFFEWSMEDLPSEVSK